MAQLVGSNSLGLGKLIDGKNQFVHIMYSANVDGSNMTADIQADTKYIGIVTSNSETAPTNPSDYSWGRFVGTSGTSSYTWLRYSPNEDGSNMTANPTPETKYIGVAITADNNAPTDYTKYSWALIKGDDGRGISKTEVTYQKSTSGTVIPTGTWVTTIPTVNAGEYLWTRTLFTYTDNTTSSTYSVARSGVTGLGISRSDVDYQKSTSGTVAPTGAWTATIPTVAANEYLWTRTTLTYTNATTSVSYSVGKMGADGRDAQLLYLTASSQIQAFDKDDKPKTTQAITISAKLQNASGTATFVAIPYIGNVAQTAITLGGTGNDRTLLPSQWTNTQWTTIAITATLGSLTDTISVIKVKDGDTGAKGSDGIAGKDGVGVSNTNITYAQSTSGTTPPTTGWSAQVPTLIKGQYLWTRTIWSYTDNSTETGYTVSYNAKDGNDGEDGIAGKDGVGIASTKVEYVGSSSGTVKPTTGWSTTIPTVAEGNYLWTKTTWTYTDGTSEMGYSVAKMGAKGDKGDTGPKGDDGIAGKDGVGLKETVIRYAGSSSGTTAPASGWQSTVPFVPGGDFLWTRTIWTYTDNSSETGYSVSRIGADGNTGKDGIAGKDGVGIKATSIQYAGSTSGTTPPTTGWTASVPTVASGSYLWTKTTWSYTDDTNETGYSVSRMGETGAKGDKGDSATSYWITPSVNTIQISTTKVLNPTTVTFTGYSKTGTANAGLYAGRFNILTSVDGIIYSSKYSSSANQSAYTYTVPADVKFIKAKMYQAGGFTALVDEVTIPIIESAEGLEIGGRNLLINTENPTVDKLPSVLGITASYRQSPTILNGATRISKVDNSTEEVYYRFMNTAESNLAKTPLVAGNSYVLSLDVRAKLTGSDKLKFRAQYKLATGNWISIPDWDGTTSISGINETTFTRISSVFTIPINATSFYFSLQMYNSSDGSYPTNGNWFEFKNAQLESGNKPTAWKPALEDAQLYTAWSKDPNGADMVRTYPNENLALGTQFKTVDDWAMTWATTNGTKTLTDDGLKLTATSTGQTGMGGGLSRQLVYGEVVTVTFKFRGLGAVEPYFLMKSGANLPITNVTSTSTTTWQEYSRGYAFPNRTEGILNFSIMVRGAGNWIEIKKDSVKIEVGNKTIYTTPPSEDPVKAEMAYIGYSPKDSNEPSDYVWIENPKAVSLYTAWSNDPNGKDMVRVYPNENIILNSQFKTDTTGWTANNASAEVDTTNKLDDLNSMKVGLNADSTAGTASRVFYRYNGQTPIDVSGSIWLKADKAVQVGVRTDDGTTTAKYSVTTEWQRFELPKKGYMILIWAFSSCVLWVAKPKVELSSISTIYTPATSDDPVNAEMKYIGYSPKDSNEPANYVWSENPKAKGTFKRWANSPDGTVDFTAVYPNENLLRTTTSESTIVGVGQSNQTDARTNYTLLTTPFNTLWADMKVGDTFTFSCDVTIAGSGFAGQFRPQTASTIWLAIGSYYNVTKAETTRVSFTGTVTQSVIDTAAVTMIQIRYDNIPTTVSIKVSKPKLERGSVATPYTTSKEEDLLLQMPQYVGIGSKDTMNPADFVWNINPEYNQARTDLGLDSKVDDETFNDAQDHMNEVVDGKADAQELQDLKDMADNLQQSYEGFVGEGGQHEADLQALEARVEGLIFELDEQVAAFDFVKTHMRLGEEGFEIAEEGSTMKMLLTNNALSFIDGGKEVASFSNQKFIINQGAIVESLQVGSHKMSRLSDKVTVFQYAPKTAVIK